MRSSIVIPQSASPSSFAISKDGREKHNAITLTDTPGNSLCFDALFHLLEARARLNSNLNRLCSHALGHALTTRSLGLPLSTDVRTLGSKLKFILSLARFANHDRCYYPAAHVFQGPKAGCRLLRPPHWRLFLLEERRGVGGLDRNSWTDSD